MYEFKTKPYKHQLEIFELTKDEEYWGIFAEMGCGKSKIFLDTMGHLYEKGKIEGCLILAPKGVYHNWSNNEIPIHLPDRILYNTDMLVWSSSKTKKYADEKKAFIEKNGRFKILVANIETFVSKTSEKSVRSFLKRFKSIICIDESTYIKSPKANRSKVIVKLCELAPYRRILTGSPSPQGPTDLYMQCRALHKDALGFKTYTAFKVHYCKLMMRDVGTHSFQQIIGYRNLEDLNYRLSKFTTRVTKSSCLDLPDKVYQYREVELTPEQKRLYKEIKEFSRTQLLENKDIITTEHVLTKLIRLHQITCGFYQPDNSEKIVAIPGANPRLNELKEILLGTTDKVIIWANYRYSLSQIEEMIKETFGEDSYVTCHGGTEKKARSIVSNVFQENDNIRFFIGNRAGAYGLTLTKSATTVYYSNDYNLEVRLQSEDRPHRIGQTRKVTYIDLVCRKTVDEKIIKALREKKNIADIITGDEWREWL